jgi:fibronectin type III domain protein/NHL repeat-containing protein
MSDDLSGIVCATARRAPGFRRIAYALIAVTALLALAACNDDDEPTPIEPGESAPLAPSNLESSSVTVNRIALTWEDESTNERGFKVYRSTSAATEGDLVATLGINAVSYADGGLSENTTYYYRVHSYNDEGSSESYASASFSTYPQLGSISTWAGNGEEAWDGDGNTLLKSSFYWPIDMLWTSTGDAYILDWNSHRVRRLTISGTLETVIGDLVGDGPVDLSDLTPAGAPGTDVRLNHPTDLLEMADGTLLLTTWHNHKLRTYDPVSRLVHVMLGRGAGFLDNVRADSGLMSQPCASVVTADGVIYTLDQRNQRIRRVDPNGVIDGKITTVVGSTTLIPGAFAPGGFSGDGGPPALAEMKQPTGSNPQPGGGMAIDAQGRIYFADTLNHRIRRVDFQADLIQTVAGNGVAAYAGDGGPATSASLNSPRDIEIGPDGRLYIADELNNVIRAVDLTSGVITTVAGNGVEAFAGDGTPATSASLARPTGIAFDAAGDLYICDAKNNRIRRVDL